MDVAGHMRGAYGSAPKYLSKDSFSCISTMTCLTRLISHPGPVHTAGCAQEALGDDVLLPPQPAIRSAIAATSEPRKNPPEPANLAAVQIIPFLVLASYPVLLPFC